MSVLLDFIRDVEAADADTRARLAKALRLDGHPFLDTQAAGERERMSLEGRIGFMSSRGPKLRELLAPHSEWLTPCLTVHANATAEADAIRAEMAALAGTSDNPGSRRWELRRELDNVEQVLSALTTGKFSESGNLEERLRALGVAPGGRTFFSRRASIKRTTEAVEVLTTEIENNEKELAALREQRAALTS